MAKSHGTTITNWLWFIGCIVLFFVGFLVGRVRYTASIPTTNPQKTTKSSLLTFTMPQVPLPPNWSSKENLPGNSFDTAFALDKGIEVQGTLNENNAIDYYFFILKSPSQVVMNISNVPKSLYWVLYNSDLKEVASSYRTGATQGSSQISVQNPGKYYVKVWADYQQFTNYPYTIRLNVLPYFE